jgi:GNAT superfamily N-acetyltransferase
MPTARRYEELSDYRKVYDFLVATFDLTTMNSYLLPAYFEYAHYLPWFEFANTHRMGIWEDDDGAIVAIVAYETSVGVAHLHYAPGFEALLPQMLDWAETELSIPGVFGDDEAHVDSRKLEVWITSTEPVKREFLKSRGYHLHWSDEIKLFDYTQPFPDTNLPEGFTLVTGTEIDPAKIAECFFYGFGNTGSVTDENIQGNLRVTIAPHANPELTTAVVAPDGRYAAALGMWIDQQNQFAYLEPLATDPDFRRLGLAKYALVHAMARTKEMGALVCDGGANPFYDAVGFKHHLTREKWGRSFRTMAAI